MVKYGVNRPIVRTTSLRAKPIVNKLQDRLRRSLKAKRPQPLNFGKRSDQTALPIVVEDTNQCDSMDDIPEPLEEELEEGKSVTVEEQVISEWRMRNRSSMEGWEAILQSLAQGYNQGTAYDSSCACKTQRVIRLVDADRITNMSIPSCNCGLWPGHLTGRGYFPGSPKKPTVAFAICLTAICSQVVSQGPFTKQGFIDCWLRFLGETSSDEVKPMDKQWLAALGVFPRMKEIAETRCSPVRKLESLCPSCFYQNNDVVVLCLDGNFAHKRFIGKGTEAAEPSTRNSSIFLPNITLPARQIKRHKESINTLCTSNFVADSDSKKSWSAFDENGIMIATCRHDIPLRALNIVKSGENYAYPAALIASIVEDAACPPKVIVCYDVACKFAATAKSLLPTETFLRLEFVVPSFHIRAHNFVCMLKFHTYYNANCGLTDGESCERVWAGLRHLVSSGRYSSSSVRHEQLTRALLLMVERKLDRLPKLLLSFEKSAKRLRSSCREKLAAVLNKVYCINERQVLVDGDYLDLQFRNMREFYSSPAWMRDSISQPTYLSTYKIVEEIHEKGNNPRRLQDLEDSLLQNGHLPEQWARGYGHLWKATQEQTLLYDATILKRDIWKDLSAKEKKTFALKSRKTTGTRAAQASKPQIFWLGKAIKDKLHKYNKTIETLTQMGNSTLRSIDDLTNLGITSELWDLDRCAPDMPWARDEKLVEWIDTYQKFKAADRELNLIRMERGRAKNFILKESVRLNEKLDNLPFQHEPERNRTHLKLRRYQKLTSQLQLSSTTDLEAADDSDSDQELILDLAVELATKATISEGEEGEEITDNETESNQELVKVPL